MFIRRGVGLFVIFAIREDDTIHKIACDDYIAGVHRSFCGKAFDLCNHKPARVFSRLCDRQHIKRKRFAFHCDVAIFIGRGATDKCDVDWN